VAAMLAGAEVAVVPSLWEEPFGMVAVEAMAVGRPVIAARGGGLTEIVADGETGFLYDARDAGQLAERLAQLLDDPALRKQFGAAARARVEDAFHWPRIIERCYPPILEALGA
jgi:glycosyltransferase involved in cell wall biosynthesis